MRSCRSRSYRSTVAKPERVSSRTQAIPSAWVRSPERSLDIVDEPIYPVDMRRTFFGREPWELAAILGVAFIANLSSRDWAGVLPSIPIGIGAGWLVAFALTRVRQTIPFVQLRLLWEWLRRGDVYFVAREEVCKPLILEGGVQASLEPCDARCGDA
ncbi:MAG: hypothetical protein HC933_08965 [Pleurocapsa sp. SU_196_0]|nr:hypothetical protein [Pleurocapsa sp. SU_196_0]